MNCAIIFLLALAVPAQNGATKDTAALSKSERLLKLHTEDASTYTFYRDAQRTQKLELRREPIYRWTNPTRVGGQVGEVFIWTYRGRPEVVASIFSHPTENNQERVLCHELHSLSQAVLVVDRMAASQWVPQAPGLELKRVPNAPEPDGTASRRLTQMRAIARDFSGRSLSDQGEHWTLRLLPQPLYRYESTDPDVLDGTLFTLVSTAGTDPEIILVLEARRTPEGTFWFFGAARFSDMSLWLKHNDQEVWTSIRGPLNTFDHDALHRFRFYQDRVIPELSSNTSR